MENTIKTKKDDGMLAHITLGDAGDALSSTLITAMRVCAVELQSRCKKDSARYEKLELIRVMTFNLGGQ